MRKCLNVGLEDEKMFEYRIRGWENVWREVKWPNLGHCPKLCLEKLGKTSKTQTSRHQGRNVKQRPLKCELVVLYFRTRCLKFKLFPCLTFVWS